MRFTTFGAIFGLVAFATAQNSTSAQASATSAAPTAEQTCLAACGATDICCKAKCVNVPCPNDLQANATTECAAKCPQGNGSPSETEQYASCQQSCISSLFFPLSATAAPTGGSGSSQATPTSSGSHGASSSGSSSGGSATSGSGSSNASPTHNAASGVRFGATGAGLIGLFIAGLAL